MSSAKKIEEYFETEGSGRLSQEPSALSDSEEAKTDPAFPRGPKMRKNRDQMGLAGLYKALELVHFPLSSGQRTNNHTMVIKRGVLVEILDRFPGAATSIKRALLESAGEEVKYSSLGKRGGEGFHELSFEEEARVKQVLGKMTHWVWRFQQLKPLCQPELIFKAVEQLCLYYFFHLHEFAEVYYIRKNVGKGSHTMIALVDPKGNQPTPQLSKMGELEKQRITVEIVESLEILKGAKVGSISYAQIEQMANVSNFKEYKNWLMKRTKPKHHQSPRHNPIAEGGESRTRTPPRNEMTPDPVLVPSAKLLGKRAKSQILKQIADETIKLEAVEPSNLESVELVCPRPKREQTSQQQEDTSDQHGYVSLESNLLMTGGFRDTMDAVGEFQNSLKRQLEIGKYGISDQVSVELRVKVTRADK